MTTNITLTDDPDNEPESFYTQCARAVKGNNAVQLSLQAMKSLCMDAALRGERVIVFEKTGWADTTRLVALELLKHELPVDQENFAQIGFRLI